MNHVWARHHGGGFRIEPLRAGLTEVGARKPNHTRCARAAGEDRRFPQALKVDGNIVMLLSELPEGAEKPSYRRIDADAAIDDRYQIEDGALPDIDEPVDASVRK